MMISRNKRNITMDMSKYRNEYETYPALNFKLSVTFSLFSRVMSKGMAKISSGA